MRSDFLIRILYILQLLMNLTNLSFASFEIAKAWSEKNLDKGGHHCSCVVSTRTSSCHLEETDDTRIALWDPLFLVSCFWIAFISLSGLLNNLKNLSSRLLNAFIYLFVGSLFLALGDHYNRDELLIAGCLSGAFFVILIASILCCSRELHEELRAHSELADDEFGQGGVFSQLSD